MYPLLKQFNVEHDGTQIVLLPSKLVWWPEQLTLFMADSHFGKASTFRKAGLAIPAGTTASMLHTLAVQTESLGARTLIVLGDLLHSNIRAVEDFEKELFEWRSDRQKLRIFLIKGNHDRTTDRLYDQLGIEFHKGPVVPWGPFDLCHAPEDGKKHRFTLCGHIHPAIQVAGQRLKCFWLRNRQLVLPAFGEFTGTARISLAANETAIAICEDKLVTVSA